MYLTFFNSLATNRKLKLIKRISEELCFIINRSILNVLDECLIARNSFFTMQKY